MEGYGKSNDDWMALFSSFSMVYLFFLFRVFFSFDELHNGAQNASVFLSFTFPKSNKSAPELYIPHLGDHVGGHWSCDQF